ncbi:Transcription factor bHLH51 [Linum grandiflorum]
MFADEYLYNSSPFGSVDHDLPPFPKGFEGGGSSSFSQALVLDSERGELVKAPTTRVGAGKEVSEAKTLAALKSHSEAERRRRERINSHLATLRGLVPRAEKMDKATLLAEVINQVKMLKQNAMESSKGLLIPTDEDEVKVEPSSRNHGTTRSFKASLCCEYRPELMSEIRQAIESLQLKLVDAEMSTLGSRVKSVFILSKYGGGDQEDHASTVDCIHQALGSVLEKDYASVEYSPRTTIPNKKRRVSYFDSSSSSC